MFSKSRKSAKTRTVRTNNRPDVAVTTRSVTAERWLHSNQIELGMYVSELDKPWEQTSFLFQGFVIDSDETLKAVQDACEYAKVYTVKQANVSSNSVYRLVSSAR